MSTDQFQGRVGRADIVVLTVLDVEFDAARRLLRLQSRIPRTSYYTTHAERETRRRRVVTMRMADRGNVPAAEAVQDAIEDFYPGYLILVGIGGGFANREGLRLGDVVVADYIDYAEFAKLQDGELKQRKQAHDHPSLFLRATIASAAGDSEWQHLIDVRKPDGSTGKPRWVEGNLLAGEKVWSDQGSGYQQAVMEYFDKAIVVEMESFGVARATFKARYQPEYNPQLMVIRGISDLVDQDNSNEQRAFWAEYAATSAAAFTAAAVNELSQTMRAQSRGFVSGIATRFLGLIAGREW